MFSSSDSIVKMYNPRKNKKHTQHIISYFAGSLSACQNNLIGEAYVFYFFLGFYILTITHPQKER